MARPRSAEEIRRDLEVERAQLASSVDDLRAAIAEAADLKHKLRAKLPAVAAAALGTGFFIGGGIGATMRLLARRSREGTVEAKVGRFRFVDRG